METIPLTSNLTSLWNQIAQESSDAWFYQTTHWLKFIEELTPARFVSNSSFFIADGDEPLAICPLIIEKGNHGKQFSFSNLPIASPAIKNSVGFEKREKILQYYIETLSSLAKTEEVVHGLVRIPSLSEFSTQRTRRTPNPFLKFGYFDLPYMTQIIDLADDLSVLWSNVRKGHKSDIKQAAKSCQIKFWHKENMSREKLSEYQEIHKKDAGRVTRSQKTFDMMLEWIQNGTAALVEANLEGKPIAFILLIIYKKGVYYGSGCKDPDHLKLPASHLIQWESIKWLKENNHHFYDIGIQCFAPQWFETPTSKEIGISRFKRGFGGDTTSLFTAEFFYSETLFKEITQQRVESYLSARAFKETSPLV